MIKKARQPLGSLFPEDCIRVFNPASGTCTPGIVHHVVDTPRSYLATTEKGRTLRKNCLRLHATGELFQFRSDVGLGDVPVFDGILCAADREELSTSIAPVFPVSAACSCAEPPKSVSAITTAYHFPVQPLRRSSRRIRLLIG